MHKQMMRLAFCLAALAASAVAQTVTGSGTTNTVPVFTGTSTVGNSPISVSGSNVGIGTTTPGDKLQVANGYVSDITGRLSRNLLDTNTWTVSNGTIGNWWEVDSTSSESHRVWGTDPFGRKALVWQDVSDGGNDASGGWQYWYLPID